MSRWPTKALAEICEINLKQNGADRLGPDAQVSFVPMAAIDESSGTIRLSETRGVLECGSGYTAFRDGDVLFAKITPCMENGKAAIARGLVNGCGFGSTEFHVLRPKSGVLPEWVFAFIRQPAFREAAKASFTGTAGQQRVPADFLKNVLLPLPSLAEQERLVRILAEAEALRRLRTQADERLTKLEVSLFEVFFGDPAENPKGFPIAALGELVSEPPNYGTMIPAAEESAEWLCLRVANIQNGTLSLEDKKYVNLPREAVERHSVKNGDLLLARAIGSAEQIGKCIIARPGGDEWAFDSHLMRVRLSNDRALPDWLQTLLVTPGGRRTFLNNTRKSAVQFNINTKEFLAIRVPLPPLSLQKQFAACVVEIRTLQAAQAASRQRLDDLFQSLLHRAFQGEL